MIDSFEQCQVISDHLNSGRDREARDGLIQLLDQLEKSDAEYSPLVNHLIREVGLYPYLKPDGAAWDDRFVYESFKADVGENAPLALHRDQSLLLSRLLEGKSLAVSAPTSFGKSFVIDAFIAIRRPRIVVIIVPTIALTDETRRRLQRKFGGEYKIITTSDVKPGEQNIYIFPQERALGYLEQLTEIDILIVDEFYKASEKFDRERAPALLRTILRLGSAAKQRYFLAPNISSLNDNPFTEGMEFLSLDFNTVFLRKHDMYEGIGKDEKRKSEALLNILNTAFGKTLIYAGSYASVDSVADLLSTHLPPSPSPLLADFAEWLMQNYSSTWRLTSLVQRGTGIHTGQLHRALSQIQIRLFEEQDGLTNLISTSSMVEGVNTSAKNVVVWRSKNGQFNLNDFMYRNIVGRGGRMFKHFVGDIFILERPPEPSQTDLQLVFPDGLLADVDAKTYSKSLSPEQVAKISAYRDDMRRIMGAEKFDMAVAEGRFQSTDTDLLREIASEIASRPDEWTGLAYLNSARPLDWERSLYKVIRFVPGGWEVPYRKFVSFVQLLAGNWQRSVPDLLDSLEAVDLGITDFFKLERSASFKLAALISDVNVLHQLVVESAVDVSPFVAKLSSAFLPRNVYELEEYGLPRMISKKIHLAGLVNLEDQASSLHQILDELRELGPQGITSNVRGLGNFDEYIIKYFFEGIRRGTTNLSGPTVL